MSSPRPTGGSSGGTTRPFRTTSPTGCGPTQTGSSVDIPQDSPHGAGTTPHPTGISPGSGQPPYVASSLHTLQNYPFSLSTDPWLPETATETVGNNVDAYIDRFGGDGYHLWRATSAPLSRRLALSTTRSTRTWMRWPTRPSRRPRPRRSSTSTTSCTISSTTRASTRRPAPLRPTTSAGEASAGDSIRAEAQDGSGINNANMNTPADGGRPRQQMYLWNGPQNETITVNVQPAAGTLPPSYGPFQIGTAAFGPQAFDVTADVVRDRDHHCDGCDGAISQRPSWRQDRLHRPRRCPCAAGSPARRPTPPAAGAVGVIIANVTARSTGRANMGPTIPGLVWRNRAIRSAAARSAPCR